MKLSRLVPMQPVNVLDFHRRARLGVMSGLRLSAADIGGLVAALEQAAGCRADLVVVAEASIPLRRAIFRDGVLALSLAAAGEITTCH